MKRIIEYIMLSSVLMACSSNQELLLLVGTYTDTDSEGLYSLRFNQETGECSPLSVTDIANPSFLAVSDDNSIVYAVTEQSQDAAVSALSLDVATGRMEVLNSQPALGMSPCHIMIAGKDVVVSNYTSGSLAVFPLAGDGTLMPGTSVEFSESGPDTVRQASSHIHSSQLSPDGKHLYVIDLGGDCIHSYGVEDGRVLLSDYARFSLAPGEGPRHFAYSADGRFLYLLTELGGNVVSFEIGADGGLSQVGSFEADSLHAAGSADIHLSPDGKFIYASNRLQGDGIAIFRQDATSGALEKVGYQNTGIHPRNFAITPNGRYLLAACRDSNLIQVFERDPETGLLTDTGRNIDIPHPVCVILRSK